MRGDIPERGALTHVPLVPEDEFIAVLVNRISEMNTSLVRLKVELEAIGHAAIEYEAEFDKILKSGKTMKDVFATINNTIDGLIR